MTSIVNQLSIWITNNATKLRDKGIEVDARIPGPGSNVPWKAGIALVYGDIVASYTVWERSILQTELFVLNYITKKTIVMDERAPAVAEVVHVDMDDVVAKLLNNTFKEMERADIEG